MDKYILLVSVSITFLPKAFTFLFLPSTLCFLPNLFLLIFIPISLGLFLPNFALDIFNLVSNEKIEPNLPSPPSVIFTRQPVPKSFLPYSLISNSSNSQAKSQLSTIPIISTE